MVLKVSIAGMEKSIKVKIIIEENFVESKERYGNSQVQIGHDDSGIINN